MTAEPQNPAPQTDKVPEAPKRRGIFLETQHAQAVVNYLKQQPYDQVAGLIQLLLRSPEVSL